MVNNQSIYRYVVNKRTCFFNIYIYIKQKLTAVNNSEITSIKRPDDYDYGTSLIVQVSFNPQKIPSSRM